jgi:hypothetical protein
MVHTRTRQQFKETHKKRSECTHQASWVGKVGASLSVNQDLALLQDPLGVGVGQGILQAVADEDDQRQALTQLVGTSRWAWGLKHGNKTQLDVIVVGNKSDKKVCNIENNIDSLKKEATYEAASHLAEHPVWRRVQALHMFSRSHGPERSRE